MDTSQLNVILPIIILFIIVAIITYGHLRICYALRKAPGDSREEGLAHKKTALQCLGSAITLIYAIFKKIFKQLSTLHLAITGTSKYIFDKDSPLTLDAYSRMKIMLFGVLGISIPIYIAATTYKTFMDFSDASIKSHAVASIYASIIFLIVFMCDKTILSYPHNIDTICVDSVLASAKNHKNKVKGKVACFLGARVMLALLTAMLAVGSTFIMVNGASIIDAVNENHSVTKKTEEHDAKVQRLKSLYIALDTQQNEYIKSLPKYYADRTIEEALRSEWKNPNIYDRTVSVSPENVFKELNLEYKLLWGTKTELNLKTPDAIPFNNYIREANPTADRIKRVTRARSEEAKKKLSKIETELGSSTSAKDNALNSIKDIQESLHKEDGAGLFEEWKSDKENFHKFVPAKAGDENELIKNPRYIDVLAAMPKYIKIKSQSPYDFFLYEMMPFAPFALVLVLYELLPVMSKMVFPMSSFEKMVAAQSLINSLHFDLNISPQDALTAYDIVDKRNTLSKSLTLKEIEKLVTFEKMQKEKDAYLANSIEDFKDSFSSYVQMLSRYPFASTALTFVIFMTLGFWFMVVVGLSSPFSDIVKILGSMNH